MKRMVMVVIALIVCFLLSSAQAEDVLTKLSIKEAMNNEKVQQALRDDVAFYWGDQSYPQATKNYGEFKTSKRTNAFGKSRKSACQWALATSLKALQKRAIREGGNAVVNIRSNIKNKEVSSAEDFECLAGTMMVNVALKGTVVKLVK